MFGRSLFKRIILLGVFIILNISSGYATESPVVEKADVIIIGAGISGIAAANELSKRGLHVIILEARDRVGGRIHTVHSWGLATDLGASWIHQINNNPLAELAEKHNIPLLHTKYSHERTFSVLESATIYDVDGKKMDGQRVKAALTQIKKFTAYLNKHVSTFNDNYSITDALKEYMKQHTMSKDSLDLVVHINGDSGEYENGANIATTSYKVAYDIQSTTSGNDVVFSNGYTELLAKLTQKIPILLNQIVTKISYDNEGVNVYTKNRHFEAKYLISTIPLGVMKAGTVEFSPSLPAAKQEAIRRIGMGVYNKVYLLFDKPFWDEHAEWFIFLSNKNKPNEDIEVLNYYTKSKRPILVAFSTGLFASELERHSDKEIIDYIMQTLKKTYGPNTPYPSSYIITHWGSDPFSQGSFSYPRIGSSENDYRILAEPIDNRVFFAGEATSLTDPSTVTGAYLSGIKAAKDIAKVIKKKQKSESSLKDTILPSI